MTKVSTVKAREQFSEVVNRAAYGKERVILTRRKKDLAAVVPIEDVKLLEALEDQIDVEAAKKSLADMKRKKQRPIPYEKIRKQLGLA
jgi:prevent-host-death family protein